MSSPQSALQVLDRHYLELRCGLLDLAAALDRLDRAANATGVQQDPRRLRIAEGLAILASEGPGRAERLQLLFSDAYEPGWTR
ncbi:MAG: hypothetical protein KF774_02995 [Planctomyces sp.]|nr:hypothetical protein [Planctomyces sp.]